MKRDTCFLGILLIIMVSSCSSVRYNQIYSYEDEFTGSTKKFSRISLKPDEERMEMGVANLIIENELKGISKKIKVYFAISRSASSFNAGKTGYIKAGDQKFELSLLYHGSELRTRNEASVSSFTSSDSTGVKSGNTADFETRTWVEDKFVIELPDKVVEKILESTKVSFRFYFGPIPATYNLIGSTLQLTKEVMK